jgi:hypothetical protein
MNRLTRPIALFLLFALSVYIVPKEFIHALYGHEDTADHSGTQSINAPHTLSTRHLHCGLLNFETDLFHTPDALPDLSDQDAYYSFLSSPIQSGKNSVLLFVSLRGPPLA